MTTVIIIDNYDSFVYNIAQMVGSLGAAPLVIRNDEVKASGLRRLEPDGIIISPGPGNPEVREDVGVSREAVEELAGEVPILGICMGHQVIGSAFGARVRRARRIMHGKTSPIRVLRRVPIFEGVPDRFEGMRYHSLVLDGVKEPLYVTAVSEDDGEVMGVASERMALYGVQFHPESIGTPVGRDIIRNFLRELR